MYLRILCPTLLLLFFSAQALTETWRNAHVPFVPRGAKIQIRTVLAINPRLARFSPEQMRIMLTSAQQTVKQNFDVDIEFTGNTEMNMERLFALIPPDIRRLRKGLIYDFKSGDKLKLAQGIYTTLTQSGTTLEAALAFSAAYLPSVHAKDLHALSTLLAEVMLERLETWHHVSAADGAPVLDASPYNEWVYWDSLGYGVLPFELVISNQLIASAEYIDVDIHSAIRGGVSVGTTTYSRQSKFGSYIFWSTFPFQDDSAYTLQLRNREKYSAREAAELSGAYLAHEIGHMLFQFGHPFGQNSCVMNPVSMLRFREWMRQIDSRACPVDSRAEMRRGAVHFTYNPDWLLLPQPQN